MATLTPQPPYPSGLEARLPPCLSLEGPRCLPDLASLSGALFATVMFSVTAAVPVSNALPLSLALSLFAPLAFVVALPVSLAFSGLRAPPVSTVLSVSVQLPFPVCCLGRVSVTLAVFADHRFCI